MSRLVAMTMLLLVLVSSCYDFPQPFERPEGTLDAANLENTVFLGGSWFSGTHSGALTSDFASYNIPDIFLNTLAQNEVSSWESFSPAVESENGFNIYENATLSGTVGQYLLEYPNLDTADFERVTTAGQAFAYANANSSIQNFSFPESGLISKTIAGTNAFESQFGFSGNTVLSAAVGASPTFFVLDAGFEDMVNFAQNGAEGDADVSDAASFTSGDLPSVALFQEKLDEIVDAFLNSGGEVKGALINIPDIIKFPYFNEIWYDMTPYIDGLPILNTVRIRAANYNGLLDFYYRQNPQIPFEDRRRTLMFDGDIAGNWGVLVEDPDLPEAFDVNGDLIKPVRHTTRDERLIMTIEERLNKDLGNTPENALKPNQYLTEDELTLIQSRITAFNQIIQQKVDASNGRLVLVDNHAYFEEMFDGLSLFLERKGRGFQIDGAPFLPIMGEFGVFSADGINLNPRGNALLTNVIIDAMNASFGGNLQNANPNSFSGTPISNR